MSNFSEEIFVFKYFYHWFNTNPSQSTVVSQDVFRDCQVNLENTANLKAAFKGGDIWNFWEEGRTLHGGT